MSYYKRHVFFCCNRREAPERCCAESSAVEMQAYAKARIKELRQSGQGKVRINKAGCLDRCEEGPVLVVYPDDVWYTYIDRSDIDEIIDRHVINGEIVDRLRILADAPSSEPLERQAEKALHDANAELCARNAAATPPSNMGATAAVLGVEGNRFFCLWAGDSRVYRIRSGSLTQFTHDHRLVQEMIDAGVLSEIDALGHPQRNVITRALGIEHPLKFDKCRGEVESGDVFVLITDGVSGICTADDIVAVVCDTAIERAADELSEICLRRGSPDNFTLILTEAKRV